MKIDYAELRKETETWDIPFGEHLIDDIEESRILWKTIIALRIKKSDEPSTMFMIYMIHGRTMFRMWEESHGSKTLRVTFDDATGEKDFIFL